MSKSLSLKKFFICLAICFGLFGGMLLVGCGPVDTSPELSFVNPNAVKTVYLHYGEGSGEEMDYDNMVLHYYPHRNDQNTYTTINLANEADRQKVEITGFDTKTAAVESQTVTLTYNKTSTTLTIKVQEAQGVNVDDGTYICATNTTLTVDHQSANQLTLSTYASVADYNAGVTLKEISADITETIYNNTYESYCAVLDGTKYFIYLNTDDSKIYVSAEGSETAVTNANAINFEEPDEGNFTNSAKQATVNYNNSTLTVTVGQKTYTAQNVEFKFDARGVYFSNNDFTIIVKANDTLELVIGTEHITCSRQG